MCISPIHLKKETPKQMLMDSFKMQEVPCGRCVECMKLRVNSWFVRLMNELSFSKSAYFMTFTYDDDNIPLSENGLMQIDYKDFQNFMKRLRKRQAKYNDDKIRYFCVGEYGSRTHRPHFHALMFNVADLADIDKEWKLGHIHAGKVEEKSIYYTLKYCLKRAHKGVLDPDDDRTPEKSLISKQIGLNYLTDAMIKHFKDDVSRPVTYLGNKKLPLPRYYRDKIFTDSEKSLRNAKLSDYRDSITDKKYDPLYTQRVAKKIQKSKEKILKTD